MTETKKPNPGSQESIEQGCKCPIIDNGHGRGYMGQPEIFVISGDCPVHWPPLDDKPEDAE